jgi:bifunctional oligoribonuclease and PAP phosphatase NrnA
VIKEKEWEQAVDLLNASGEIVAACHINPDGDALGSMLALAAFLERQGKKVWRSWGNKPVDVPPQYSFMPGAASIVQPDVVPLQVETFVSVDCADRARLGLLEPAFEGAGARLNIDHHISNDLFGDINLVAPDAASNSELIYKLIRRMGGTLDSEEATCLYTGIVTDTGRFQYANTTPETLRIAAELRELGVDHEFVATEVYESTSFEYLHALGIVLFRARLEDGMVWSRLDRKDLGGLDLDETEHFIDALRTVRESHLAVLLKELEPGYYKASLRSRGEVDVSAIAKALGGGGHTRAAGFEIHGSADEIIARIKALIPPD